MTGAVDSGDGEDERGIIGRGAIAPDLCGLLLLSG